VMALVASTRAVAASVDGGATWTRGELPSNIAEPLAVAVGSRGELLVFARDALAVGDARSLTRIPLPRAANSDEDDPYVRSHAYAPAVHVTGDRWIVVDGVVHTTDDQGAHWRVRHGDDQREQQPPVVAAVFHGEDGLLLDTSRQLWRTNDAGTTFQHVATVDAQAHNDAFERRTYGVTLAWDGAARVAVVAGAYLTRSSDAGATWVTPRTIRSFARGATFAPDGNLVAVLDRSVAPQCSAVEVSQVIAVETRTEPGFAAVADACRHNVAAFAFDAGGVYVATRHGTVYRGDLRRLEPASETANTAAAARRP
jgi:hypothetical protein